jgi:hypothetical protein
MHNYRDAHAIGQVFVEFDRKLRLGDRLGLCYRWIDFGRSHCARFRCGHSWVLRHQRSPRIHKSSDRGLTFGEFAGLQNGGAADIIYLVIKRSILRVIGSTR